MLPPEPDPLQARLDAISEALARSVRRQNELEQRVAQLEVLAEIAPPAQPAPPIAPPVTFREPIPPPLPTVAPMPVTPELETRVGLNWLNRIAVITLLFGVAFFFKYAIDSGWIGPGLRVALGIVAGTLALAVGEWMSMRAQRIFAQGVTGLGLSLLYLSFYASFAFYNLLPQSAVFVLMLLTTVGAAFLALHYNAQAVAILGLLGGFLTPPLLATGEDHPYVLLFTSLLLSAGAILLARLKNWPATVYLSFIGTAVFYAAWSKILQDNSVAEESRGIAILWIALAFCLYLCATKFAGLALLIPNAIVWFGASYISFHRPYDDWMGALALLFALAHAVWGVTEKQMRTVCFAIAAGFVTLAIPLQFSSFRITIAWAIEAAVLAWLASRENASVETSPDKQLLPGQGVRFGSWCVLALAIARLAIADAHMYPSADSYALIGNLRFLSFAAVAASLWFVSYCANISVERGVPYAIGHAVMLWALLLESGGWVARNFDPVEARSISSLMVSFAVMLYAFGLVAAGVLLKRWLDRVLALALFGLVIAKLYLSDVWDLSRGLRILAFLGLGVMLLLVSYLYSRFKPALEKLLARTEEMST